jgi:hypothetical protein
VTYRGLVAHLAEILGYHQIPLNPAARDIHTLLDGSPLHDDMTRQLLRAIYKKNRCNHLDSRIAREATEAVLVEIRQGALRAESTDVDKHGFLEDLCFAVDRYFRGVDHGGDAEQVSRAPRTATGNILDLTRYRRIRKRA